MLARPPELAEALGVLDPTHRALLELSLHREVADPALAELLRTEVDTVVRQRADALERLGGVLDATPAEVEEALIQHWRGEPEEAPYPGPETPEAEPEPPAEPEAPAEPERSGRRGLWLGVTALAAIGLALLLALSGGGDDGESDGPDGGRPSTEGQEPPPPSEGAEPVPLEALAAAAAGTARIVERDGARRLELRLRGLSEGGYAVWLYNSIGDARQLATARGPGPFVSARLPDGYERFRYIDVSQEPNDANPNHSGASVLRVATKDLSPS